MLVDDARGSLPFVGDSIGKPKRSEAVEGEILSLRAVNICVAIDPAQPHATRDVWSNSTFGVEEVVTKTDRNAVIEIFRATEDRFYHGQGVELVIPAQPSFAENWAEPPSRGDELSTDLVAVWVANNAEHISRFSRHLETGRVRIIPGEMGGHAIATRVRYGCAKGNEQEDKNDTQNFHKAALRYGGRPELQFDLKAMPD